MVMKMLMVVVMVVGGGVVKCWGDEDHDKRLEVRVTTRN